MRPLNGVKTHPLSEHAMGVLRSLAFGDKPRQEINPGVANRLEREALAETYFGPSAYQHLRHVQFLRITDAGRAALAAKEEQT